MYLVTIITPTYNSEAFIRQTYSCILAQTYQQWEWLVTDDCSNDQTWDILKKLAYNDCRVKVARNNSNSGAAITRNNSIIRARGYFLAFIDADDLWTPDKLEKQIDFMGKDVNFSFTAYEIIDENGVSVNKFIDKHHFGAFSYEDMLRKKATLGCSTVMIRKNAFKDLHMPNIRTGQDYALWLKLLRSGQKAYLLNQPLTKYRIVSGSISRNKFRKAKRQWQIYRKIENLGILKSCICFSYYAFRAVFR